MRDARARQSCDAPDVSPAETTDSDHDTRERDGDSGADGDGDGDDIEGGDGDGDDDRGGAGSPEADDCEAGPPRDGSEAAADAARRGPVRRVLLVLTALLSVAVVVVTTTGWFVVTFYDRRIDRETIAPPADITVTRPPPAPVGTETWLLVGSDVRTGSDAAEVGGARSDTMMIAHLASDGRTNIVSIPRDLRVPIPAWTDDDGSHHRARQDKINAAFSNGGPALLVATLEQVAGLRIDHYAELDFSGFQQMTSAIGGIDVCLQASPYVEPHTLENGRRVRSTNLNDPSSGFVGQPGNNHLTGGNALAFVRQRHGFADGDLSRIRRQQTFLAAMFRKVSSGDVLLRPTKLAAFLSAVTRSVVLDDETGFAELRALAERMRGMTTGAVTFSTVPITGQVAEPAFYFFYDPAEMRQFFRNITGGESLPEPTGSAEPIPLGGAFTPQPPSGTPTAPTAAPALPPTGGAAPTATPQVPEAAPTPALPAEQPTVTSTAASNPAAGTATVMPTATAPTGVRIGADADVLTQPIAGAGPDAAVGPTPGAPGPSGPPSAGSSATSEPPVTAAAACVY
ncbi:LCP family protein [Parafrankia discariae]|uniref:LCP family protein n=1 Tax=Parafrankia discariae TaxID=365528 RepID=UPI00036F9891|nr:LCP family protein [Parafrankia discariae]